MLLEENNKLALVDAGFGLSDTQKPKERIGEKLIEMAGFHFNESWTAYKQIQQLGLDPLAVRHCVVSHLDPDHIGALIDFPDLILVLRVADVGLKQQYP